MPFIDSKITVSVPQEKRDILKAELGKVVAILTNCKTVMITKPELNQRYMEEYLNVAYGVDYKYEKPFENVYVHVEDIVN